MSTVNQAHCEMEYGVIKEQTGHGDHDRGTENKLTMKFTVKEQPGHGNHDRGSNLINTEREVLDCLQYSFVSQK